MGPTNLSLRTLFAPLLVALCAFSTAHAQENCSAEASPISGWRPTAGQAIVLDDQGTTYDAVGDTVEVRTINWLLAQGWTAISVSRHVDDFGPSHKIIGWSWTAIDPSGEPFTSESDFWVDVVAGTVCPSGYAQTFSEGSPYCVASNINLRQCSTEPKPDNNRGCNADGMEGNPCNLGTGNKFQVEWDYRGVGTSHLQYARYYNSDSTTPRGLHQ